MGEFWRNKNVRLSLVASSMLLSAIFVWLGIYLVARNQVILEKTTTQVILPVLYKQKPLPIFKTAVEMPRRLDGVLVNRNDANRYPVALMIENAAFGGVRPQFGLNAAQLVYEIVVEGGITRFMAVYSGDFPEKIGPIRSARATYLEFASEYDALYGHAGGSPEALQAISGMNVKDLSALSTDARFFKRDVQRESPHNLFTYASLINYVRRDKNLADNASTYLSWNYKNDTKSTTAPDKDKTVDIDFGSSPLYNVHYVYNFTNNNYERWNGNELQHDANDNSVLVTKNIIIQIVPPGQEAVDQGRINFSVTGEGSVYIARDGEVIEGTWKKADRLSRTQFYDKSGQIIQLNRGNSWVEILPNTGKVSYQ
ncbi:MAG: DUF3048 domain-containing protein [Patescibacteria group bacterium]|jgi:hypothetical protein